MNLACMRNSVSVAAAEWMEREGAGEGTEVGKGTLLPG